MSSADYPQVVYLWGDDEWSMERIVSSIAARLAEDTGVAPDRWRPAQRVVTADAIAERVAIAPMFGGGTVAVVVVHADMVRSKAAREALDRVVGSVAPGNALVLLEFDGSGGRKRPKTLVELADAIVKAGGTVRPCRAPSTREMPAWIDARASELGLRMDRDAATELARRVGSSVDGTDIDRRAVSAMAMGELAKLSLYRGTEPVTPGDVRDLVAEVVPESLFGIIDGLANRNTGDAGPALDRLLSSQPEQIVLVLLHRRMRELLIAADARAAGASPPEIVKLIGGSPYAAQIRVDQAGRWTVPELVAALDGLLELDRMSKHADAGGSTDGQRRMAWATWVAERVARSGGTEGGRGRAAARR